MFLRICLFLLISGFFFSCKKKELTFSMKGTVTDTSFNQGLQGAVLKLYEISNDGSISNSPVGQTTIAADGSYDLSFPRHKVVSYQLSIEKSLYFKIAETISFSEFSTDQVTIRNYSTAAKSWVRLVFINQSPANAADELHFTKQSGKTGCDECCSASEQIVSGIAPFEMFCVNDGNTVYSYLQTNNQSAPSIESVTTIPFDTVDLIKYW